MVYTFKAAKFFPIGSILGFNDGRVTLTKRAMAERVIVRRENVPNTVKTNP